MPDIEKLELIVDELQVPKVGKKVVSRLLTGLQERYEEKTRYYHTFEHPLSLFNIFLPNKSLVANPDVVGWTIFYHDAIYNPKAARGLNEENSAGLAVSELPTRLGQMVAHYTRATAEHRVSKLSPGLAFFLDLDLSILGAQRPEYQRYAQNIRKEYEHVPAGEYRLGRIAVLESLAKRSEDGAVYQTEFFSETYGQQAAENIAWELEGLKA